MKEIAVRKEEQEGTVLVRFRIKALLRLLDEELLCLFPRLS